MSTINKIDGSNFMLVRVAFLLLLIDVVTMKKW